MPRRKEWSARQRSAYERRRAKLKRELAHREDRRLCSDALAERDFETLASVTNEVYVPIDDSLAGCALTLPEYLPGDDAVQEVPVASGRTRRKRVRRREDTSGEQLLLDNRWWNL